MRYQATVNAGGKSFVAKTDASSAAEAYNKIYSTAISKFPGVNIMVFKPVPMLLGDVSSIDDVFNTIFKGFNQ